MNDSQKLLMLVLKKHYCEKQEILQKALQLIKDYSENSPAHGNYDELLKSLHNLMSDLPLNILVYFLSTVPLPKGKECINSNFVELMKKTNQAITNNIRPILLDYLEKLSPSTSNANFIEPMELDPSEDYTKYSPETSVEQIDCKPLQDICMDYILTNMSNLKNFYESQNRKAWNLSLVNNQEFKTRCYCYIKNLNLKLKWLRMIEEGYITVDALKEVYGDSEEVLEKCVAYKNELDNLFVVDDELWKAITKLVSY